MPRRPRWCNDVAFHRAALAVWGLLVIPTLTIWSESLLWIAFMSIYAILGTHQGALEAALAKRKIEETSASGEG